MQFTINSSATGLFKGTFLEEAVKYPGFIFDTDWEVVKHDDSYIAIFNHFVIPKGCVDIVISEVTESISSKYPFIQYDSYVIQLDLNNVKVKYNYYAKEPRFYQGFSEISDLKFDPMVIPDEEGNCYNLPTKKKFRIEVEHAQQQIKSRYVFTDRPASGLSNTIIDSFYPGLLFKYKMNPETILLEEKFPKTSYTISPFISSLTGIKEIPFEDVLAHLGYNSRTLKQLLTTVKRKRLSFIFAGVGGTGSNTIYWLSKMCNHVNLVNLFNKVYVFEKESIEVSNTLRFPFPISDYHHSSNFGNKMDLVAPYLVNLSEKTPSLINMWLKKESYQYYAANVMFRDNQLLPNHIIYGAPSLDMRNEISDIGPFIAATHSSNECSVWLNPRQEDDLALETYGLIQLAPFFMNQIKLVLSTLELLASDQDLTEQDKHIMDFSFNGEAQSRTSRVYNWQIQQTALVMTDEQANAI